MFGSLLGFPYQMWWDCTSVRSCLIEWIGLEHVHRTEVDEFLKFVDTRIDRAFLFRRKRTVAAAVLLCIWHLYGNDDRGHLYYPSYDMTHVRMQTVDRCWRDDGFLGILKAYRQQLAEQEFEDSQRRLEEMRLSSPDEIVSTAPSPMNDDFEDTLRRWFVGHDDVFIIVYIAEHRLHLGEDFASGRTKHVEFLDSVGEKLTQDMLGSMTKAIFALDPPQLRSIANIDIVATPALSLTEKWKRLLAHPYVACLPCGFVLDAIQHALDWQDTRAVDLTKLHIEVGSYSDEKDPNHRINAMKKKGVLAFYRNDVTRP
jgi:hypothetical protein